MDMRFWHRSAFVVLGSLVTLSSSADPSSWVPNRYPFLPKVITGEGSPVCSLVVAGYQQAFKTGRLSLSVKDFLGAGDPDGTIQWVGWDEVDLPFDTTSAEDKLYRADLSLDGDGRKQTVIYSSVEFSWRGPTYKATVFADAADFTKTLAASKSIDDVFADRTRFFGDNQAIGEWYWNDLFHFAGAYYFIDEQPDFFNAAEVQVYRVHGDGKKESVCDIQMMPDKQETDAFAAEPGIRSYLDVLWIMGNGGPDQGTLHAALIHDSGITGAIERAAIRPWAASRAEGGYYGYSQDLEVFLNDWGHTDPWSLREYDSFLEHRGPAKKMMQRYLVDRFGLSEGDASIHGEKLFEDLMGAFFEMPSEYFRYKRDDSARERIADGGLAGDLGKRDKLNDLLAFAVENPRALTDLISRGADVNSSNEFGKTPLMYAAHLDRPDTVALLLKDGADPNAVTHDLGWGDKFERSDRTALMYAAENASVRVMGLLVAAGAKTDIHDSAGNGLDFYLAKNPYLTAEDQKLGVVELVKRDGAATIVPSFDCAKASSRGEKAICSDEILMLEDGELGGAYKKLRLAHPDDHDIVEDQASWLKRRDSFCGQQTDDYQYKHCMQRMTRARTRYLQERADEGATDAPFAGLVHPKKRHH